MRKYLYLVIVVLATLNATAQKYEIGVEIGYGRGYKGGDDYLYELFEGTSVNSLHVGIPVSSNPNESILFINSGLFYQGSYGYDGSLNSLKVPVGFDLVLGSKTAFVFGGGLYARYTYLLKGGYSLTPHRKANFQVGTSVDMGIRQQISRNLVFYVKAQGDFDMAQFCRYSWYCPSYNYGYWFLAGVKYRIPSYR